MDNPKNLDQNFISKPENITTPDQVDGFESGPTSAALEQPTPALATSAPAVPDLDKIASAPAQPTIVLEKVENILARDMDKVFLSMDLATQAKFKAKGEETAVAITNLLQKTKVQVRKIINLIVDWLRLVPSINKYYLEQEAKLKAEEIIRLHKNQ
ncbi:MAG: hypothetical protein WC465_00550 [Patescibacteria group bacterium]